jgi:nitrate reductase / nitrite oxidoreductase, alpha subunit
VASYVANAVAAGTIKMSIEDVDAPENWPRTLTLWRSNLFGSSAKATSISSNTCSALTPM